MESALLQVFQLLLENNTLTNVNNKSSLRSPFMDIGMGWLFQSAQSVCGVGVWNDIPLLDKDIIKSK